MANEIQFQAQCSISSGGATISSNKTKLADLASSGQYMGNTQNIGTVAEAINFVDVAPGVLMLENLADASANPTHSVDIALDSAMTNKFATLMPGDPCVFPVASGVTLYAKAAVAAVDIRIIAAERA